MDLDADWEMLHLDSDDSPTAIINSSPVSVVVNNNFKGLEGIEGDSDSEGIIRSDYFSLDSQTKYPRAFSHGGDVTEGEEEGSVESDNPSWIDPATEDETRYRRKEPTEFWSDSSSDRSEEVKLGCDTDAAKNEFGIVELAEASDVTTEDSVSGVVPGKFEDSVGADVADGAGAGKEGNECGAGVIVKQADDNENVAISSMKSASSEEVKRVVVWWRLPLELLKYCMFRVGPVWSISMAAAMMGVVILGRRLYRMKRRGLRSLQMKVTDDDKKVSQFMGRAARLNEAFSVVKRVPVIRPLLPAAGVTPWPMMSLR